ncbi:hypothetical protein IAU60_002665 [Kwoniella sp. DSM 27419]
MDRARRTLHTTSPASPLNLLSASPLIRPHSPSIDGRSRIKPDDFKFWPGFFSDQESRVLLRMALWKLDRADSTLKRRRGGTKGDATASGPGLQAMFGAEYGFEEGHYDSVIHQYRETLLSSLPPSPEPILTTTLARLYALLPDMPPIHPVSLPPQGTLTHLLHLAPDGEILPHVDNLEASGSVICGVSLGAERTLRLQRKGDGPGEAEEGWDVRLPSGSVYLQRDSIRYQYEHSILPYSSQGSIWDGSRLDRGHRISIMIRDAPVRPASL